MRPNIDFVECLKDSPRFRASLEETEHDIDVLESKLEKLVKLCNSMIEAGKTYNNANSAFINGVKDVAMCFKEDELVSEALKKFTHVLSEQQKYHNILLDQAHRSIYKNLNSFIKNDIKKVKETQKHFNKISDDMDAALTKNSQSPRSKPQECEDANNVLTAMRSCFGHTSLDYVFQINILHSKKRFDVLDTMLAFMHAQSTFYHQGYDLFDDIEPYMKQVAAQLEDLNTKAIAKRKEMEERHTLVQQKELTLNTPLQFPSHGSEAQDDIRREGYLFKRTSNAFKTWVRRWFMIQDNQLVYRKRSKDSLTIMEDDLRLCTVKPAGEIDRRWCFEVVSPSRSHMLQADSENECQEWITAIQQGVSKAYSNRHSSFDSPSTTRTQNVDNSSTGTESSEGSTDTTQPSGSGAVGTTPSADKSAAKKTWQPKSISRMQALLSLPGNNACCDCGSPDPRWASINLGITLCIECSGIHRSFGVHLSKVRSLTLDAWEPELLKVMTVLGNDQVNSVYQACLQEGIAVRATPHCDRNVRETWIRTKYVKKAFVRRLPEGGSGEAGANQPGSPKRWSVFKRRRRSPPKSLPREKGIPEDGEKGIPEDGEKGKPEDGEKGIPEDGEKGKPEDGEKGKPEDGEKGIPQGVPEDGEEGIKQGESQDSGLGGSTADVIVFGAANETESSQPNIDLDLDDSGSEPEADQDATSTTSLEDFTKLHPDMLLFKASQARNVPVMLEALAMGATPNWHNEEEHGKTPLIKAVESGSMAPVEFLLLNGAKVDFKDHCGRSPLHHASILGHTGQVCQFLKRNANQHAVDEDGMDPLSIAINNANADIVTLLRLAKLNEEMRETEGIYGSGGDETFNEVFRDFTNMANNAPEKLNRNK